MIKNDEELKQAEEAAAKMLASFDSATNEWAKANNISPKILDGIRTAYEEHYYEICCKIDHYICKKAKKK